MRCILLISIQFGGSFLSHILPYREANAAHERAHAMLEFFCFQNRQHFHRSDDDGFSVFWQWEMDTMMGTSRVYEDAIFKILIFCFWSIDINIHKAVS